MQVIITDAGSSRSYAFNFSWFTGFLLALLLVVAGAVGMRMLSAAPVEDTQALIAQHQHEKLAMQQSMADLARKVGEVQAKLVHLQSLSDRVVDLADVPEAEKNQPLNEAAGQGGTLVSARPVEQGELLQVLNQIDSTMTAQSDWLLFAEARLFDAYLRRKMIPTQEPVPGKRAGSSFGRRIDPINGSSAIHTGLDFQAPKGTPIYAAAGGVVITHQYHSAYGNMLEIDHGNELVTRYAHATDLLVSRGDVVRRGDKIATVGSTGRSTGPHLHFEVLVQGQQQDPQKFLDAGATGNWQDILASK